MNVVKYLALLVTLVLVGCGKSGPEQVAELAHSAEPEHIEAADAEDWLLELRARREAEREIATSC